MDLPTTLETAELGPGGGTIGQAGGQAQPVHRVKSMFQQVPLNLLLLLFPIVLLLLLIATHHMILQSTGKLTPPRLPTHPPPPQRSISHSEVRAD